MEKEELEAIYPQFKAIIADALVVDEEEIELDKRLIGDLGAESIDFLDMRFQIEKEFKVVIKQGEIEQKARQLLGDEKFEAESGFLTPRGLEVLKQILSDVPSEYFKDEMKVSDIPSLLTVRTFCRLICEAQKETQEVLQG
jgi:acyl carrier protein